MSGKNEVPLVVKLLVAVALAIFLAPFVIALIVVLLSALAGGTWLYGTQKMVAESRMSSVRSTVGALARGAESQRMLESLTPCGDAETALSRAVSQADLKETPPDCLVSLGADSWPGYGQFWVVPGPPFEVHGVVDLDGDGEVAHYLLKEGETSLQTLSDD